MVKNKGLLIALVMSMVMSPAFAATYYWVNPASNDDFSLLTNWNTKEDGTGTLSTNLAAHTLRINKIGDDKAVLSTTLADKPASIMVTHTSDKVGEMLISGGINALGANCSLRVAVSGQTKVTSGAIATFTMTGGTLSVMDGYTTFADGGSKLMGSTATVNISGGILNTDRITIAQYLNDIATVNMTGGTINLSVGDLTPPITSGSLRGGDGDGVLNVSGNAVINTPKLGLRTGLKIKMNGGTLNVLGFSVPAGYAGDKSLIDPNTFDFTEDTIAAGQLLGEIEFNAGRFTVDSDYESVLDAAIASGNIYTTVPGMIVDAEYYADADPNVTELLLVVPSADINGSGDVDIEDLKIICRDWLLEGADIPVKPNGDLDLSGKVDLEDFAILGRQW
jgi:hypothetical protein